MRTHAVDEDEEVRECDPPMDGKAQPDGNWLAVGPLGVFAAVLEFEGEEDGAWHLVFLPNDQLDECVDIYIHKPMRLYPTYH